MKNRLMMIFFLFWGTLNVFAQASDVDNMFPNAIMKRAHYDKLIVELKKGGSGFPRNWYMKQIYDPAYKIVSTDRKTVPATSIDNNPQKIDIKGEMEMIQQLCLAYAFTLDKSILNKAVEYLKAWSAVNVADHKKNIHENIYCAAVEGYSVIRKVIDYEDRKVIDEWVLARAKVFVGDNDLRDNNWGTALMYQYYLFGTVLEDQQIVDKYSKQYDLWAKNNLFPNGTTTDLLCRDAFAYHAYNLLFYAKIFHLKAMYKGYELADAFYAKNINWGASVKKSVNFWKPFLQDPRKYTHLEFVGTEYAPDKARSDYNKPYKPAGTLYSVYALYEADQSLGEILRQYKQQPEWTLAFGLSSLRWHYNAD